MPTGALNQKLRRDRMKEAGGSHTKSDIAELRALQQDRCLYCSEELYGKGHVDHIIPVCRGGNNSKENLQILCVSCNCIKGNLVLGELYEPIVGGLSFLGYSRGFRKSDWLEVYRKNYLPPLIKLRPADRWRKRSYKART